MAFQKVHAYIALGILALLGLGKKGGAAQPNGSVLPGAGLPPESTPLPGVSDGGGAQGGGDGGSKRPRQGGGPSKIGTSKAEKAARKAAIVRLDASLKAGEGLTDASYDALKEYDRVRGSEESNEFRTLLAELTALGDPPLDISAATLELRVHKQADRLAIQKARLDEIAKEMKRAGDNPDLATGLPDLQRRKENQTALVNAEVDALNALEAALRARQRADEINKKLRKMAQ